MKKVYTHYSDGVTTLTETGSDANTWTMIPAWQWALFCLYRTVDRRVVDWLQSVDNRAFRELDSRNNKGV